MDRKYHIGLLVSNLDDDFCGGICRGALSAAAEAGVDLFLFPGKYLGRAPSDDETQAYEYQFNTVFSFAQEHALDLLIAPIGSFGYCLSAAQKEDFLRMFSPTPILTIAYRSAGASSLQYDNAAGMEELLHDLTEARGLRRLGFIGGPPDNDDAREREQIFRLFLAQHRLPLAPGQIVHGDCTRACRGAVEALLDAGLGIEALVCVNDATALGAYEVLKERGLEIGRDIAVTGFDDVEFAANLNPPLATVHADAADLGQLAVRQALNFLVTGRKSDLTLPTHFLLRASADATLPAQEGAGAAGAGLYRNPWYAHQQENREIDRKALYAARNILMIGDQLTPGDYAFALRKMYIFGIQKSYLYLFGQPICNRGAADWKKPAQLYLCAEQQGETVSCAAPRPVAADLFLQEPMRDVPPEGFVVLPLYCNEMLYGLCVCSLPCQSYPYAALIVSQISAALRITRLIWQNEESRQKLKAALDITEAQNAELDQIAQRDPMTGLLNRRGMRTALDTFCCEAPFIGVLYGDIDHLKTINDRFGHSEGDFAIERCAGLLRDTLPAHSILVRMGGDEFVAVFPAEEKGFAAALPDRIVAASATLNRRVAKPYSIGLSVGVVCRPYTAALALDALLAEADRGLYQKKRRRHAADGESNPQNRPQ